MKEACGVVGIVAPGRDVSYLCYDALYALQHRGQESAGMATFQNEQITVVKDNGLVSHVFAESTLRALGGSIVIGHTRYSTSGSANWTAAQPVYRSAGLSGFALGHNGNLTNTTRGRGGVMDFPRFLPASAPSQNCSPAKLTPASPSIRRSGACSPASR